MKTIGIVAVILVALLRPVAHAASPVDVDQVQQAMYASLVLDEDLGKSRLGTRAIRKFYAKNESLTDLIAERLFRATVVHSRNLNTIAWYAIILGETHNSRYRTTLQQVQQRTTDKKLLDDIGDALKEMTDESAVQYVPGTVDIEARKATAKKILIDNRRTDRGKFSSIKPGTTLVEILETLGAPDDLTAWTVRTQKLEVHYYGSGLVVLSVDNLEPLRWVTYTVASELIPVQKIYSGENPAIAQNLGSLQNKLLVQFYKTSGRKIHRDLSAMEVVARRVTAVPYSDNKYEEQTVLGILKRLALMPDPRAETIIRSVADSPVKNDGTKFAKRMLRIREKLVANGKLVESAANDPDPKEEDDDEDEDDPKDK